VRAGGLIGDIINITIFTPAVYRDIRLEHIRLEDIRLEHIRLEHIRLEHIRLEHIRLEHTRLEDISILNDKDNILNFNEQNPSITKQLFYQ